MRRLRFAVSEHLSGPPPYYYYYYYYYYRYYYSFPFRVFFPHFSDPPDRRQSRFLRRARGHFNPAATALVPTTLRPSPAQQTHPLHWSKNGFHPPPRAAEPPHPSRAFIYLCAGRIYIPRSYRHRRCRRHRRPLSSTVVVYPRL